MESPMEQSELDSILKEFRIDSSSFKAKIVSLNSEVRGKAEFTDQVWSPSIVPVMKFFHRNPSMNYRFIAGDKILVLSATGVESGRTIYYGCEIVKGIPTNNWWYFQYDNPFLDSETLLEAS